MSMRAGVFGAHLVILRLGDREETYVPSKGACLSPLDSPFRGTVSPVVSCSPAPRLSALRKLFGARMVAEGNHASFMWGIGVHMPVQKSATFREPPSSYADMTAEEVVGSFNAANKRLNTNYLLIMFVLLAVFVISIYVGGVLAGAVMLIFYVVVNSLASKKLSIGKAKLLNGLHDILLVDCDPKKYLDVVQCMMDTFKKKMDQRGLQLIAATCAAQLGCREDALQWIDRARASSRKDFAAGEKAVVDAVLSLAYTEPEDREKLEAVRADALALAGQNPKDANLQSSVHATLASIDVCLARQEGDFDRARRMVGEMVPEADCPQQIVDAEYRLGLIDGDEGDLESACEHMAYVADHANTLAVGRCARTWLDQHA